MMQRKLNHSGLNGRPIGGAAVIFNPPMVLRTKSFLGRLCEEQPSRSDTTLPCKGYSSESEVHASSEMHNSKGCRGPPLPVSLKRKASNDRKPRQAYYSIHQLAPGW